MKSLISLLLDALVDFVRTTAKVMQNDDHLSKTPFFKSSIQDLQMILFRYLTFDNETQISNGGTRPLTGFDFDDSAKLFVAIETLPDTTSQVEYGSAGLVQI